MVCEPSLESKKATHAKLCSTVHCTIRASHAERSAAINEKINVKVPNGKTIKLYIGTIIKFAVKDMKEK